MESLLYNTTGTCSKQIEVCIDNGTIVDVKFHGGCNGNTQGVAALVKGMNAEDAIRRLEGIDCNGKGTSCPDQLAKAIKVLCHK